MAASASDLVQRTFNTANPNVARVTATRVAAGATLTCDNLSGWPTTTGVSFSTYRIDTNNNVVAGTQIDWVGVVTSSTTIGSLTRVAGAADTGSAIGDVVEMNPTATWADRFAQAFLAQHNQLDGTHSAITATSLVAGSINTTAANGINQAALPLGAAVQQVSTVSTAVQTGSTLLPLDDTIPQITEGNEYMTCSITPKATTNILVIQVVVVGSSSVGNNISAALFQDATANALAASNTYQATATGTVTLPLTHTMTAGTTSATTFRIRCGSPSAATFTFNGASSGRYFGGITKSSIVITEYKA